MNLWANENSLNLIIFWIQSKFFITFFVPKFLAKESGGWCVDVNNGCRENFSERVNLIGYPNMTKEDCLQSCMQTPEALGCEYGLSHITGEITCKVFSFPVSIGIGSEDIYSYDHEPYDKSHFTCWSINRSKLSNCNQIFICTFFYNLFKEKYIWAFIIVKLDSINSTDGKIAKPPTTSIYVFRRSNFTGNNLLSSNLFENSKGHL